MTPFVKILKANILNARICKDLGEKELANFFSNQAKLQLAEAGFVVGGLSALNFQTPTKFN